MPDQYRTDGTENLRADPHQYDGSEKSPPSGAGKDAGGTDNMKSDHKLLTNDGKTTGTYAKDSRPAGLQHFEGGSV